VTKPETVQLDHERLGRLEIPRESILAVAGLPGFPDVRRLALVHHDRPTPFAWLLAMERPDLAFVVVDPRLAFPSYAPRPNDDDLRAIGAEPGDEIGLLAIANLSEPGRTHVNLAAPILANPRTHRAVQAILPGTMYSTRAVLGDDARSNRPDTGAAPTRQIESNPQR